MVTKWSRLLSAWLYRSRLRSHIRQITQNRFNTPGFGDLFLRRLQRLVKLLGMSSSSRRFHGILHLAFNIDTIHGTGVNGCILIGEVVGCLIV